jgi:pyrroline-5-carboxylate reductase
VKIAIVGVGSMGGAVLAGLVAAGHDVLAGVRRPERGAELADLYGVDHGEAAEVAAAAEVIILGVKPYDILRMVAALPLREGQLVISLAAGITTAQIEAVAPAGVGVVRVMPNTPAVLGQGMSIISAGATASADQFALT